MASKRQASRFGKQLGKNKTKRARRGTRPNRFSQLALEHLEARHVLATLTFVDVGSTEVGYKGTEDTVLQSLRPDVNFGTETAVSVDQQDANGAHQGLLKFGDIFTTTGEIGKIPLGSTINNATVTFSVFNESSSQAVISLYPMLQNWDQLDATWNRFRPPGGVGGVQASEGEAAALADGVLLDPTSGAGKVVNVTSSLRRWATGDPNNGWLVESVSTNGWDFDTSENAAANRPRLFVDFTPPVAGNSGQFQFLDIASVKTEGDSGNSVATIRVARVGGVTGSVSVDYAITGGTATVVDDYVTTSGTLTFDDPAENVKTIEVTVKGDTLLEGLETIVLSLSNPQNLTTPGSNLPTIDAAADEHTVTIGDDDALINEVLANIFSPTNASITEANREYVELIGTPGASLAGYYFVVFESEEEEPGAPANSSGDPTVTPFGANVDGDAGRGSGKADLVIDLSALSFGANGLLVITPAAWAYSVPAGTSQVTILPNNALEDNSQTYALIRSATPMVQGRDYDTEGRYTMVVGNPATVAQTTEAGVGVGVLDKLPAGAQIVDIVGVVEGGSGDRDRVSTLNAPGVHIHQPVGNEGNVTPDAISRRFGDRTPNSAGPWYNGEIDTDALAEIIYVAAGGRQNVVTPPGARLTPGSPNGLTTVGFELAESCVQENVAGGKLTVTATRVTSEPAVPLTLNYATSNGTASAGSDYVAVTNGQITFAPNELVATFEIDITNDTEAESFETFRITLSSAADPYQIVSAVHTVTIEDNDALIKTFQQGANGYTGSQDATINSRTPDIGLGGPGTAATIIVDEELGLFTGADAFPAQGLIRFDGLFGDGANQVPAGAKILGGFLKVNIVPTGGSDADAQVRFFRMLKEWDELGATWNDPQGNVGSEIAFGVTPDDVEAYADPDFIVPNPATAPQGTETGKALSIPLNLETLQAWANGVLPNFGWSIVVDGGNSWEFSSANDFLNPNAFAPELTILYTQPTGPGAFRFSDAGYRVNEDGTATISVERVGGTTGSATVDFAVAAGTTGSLADVSGTNGTANLTGQLMFSGTEAQKSFTVQINNDNLLERNEILNLSISGTGLTFDRAVATLTIRDNDFSTASPSLRLNELYINDPGNDGGHEFIEFLGTADSAMGGLYLFVIDGDSGSGLGAADLVIDLGSTLNGSNGLSIVHGATGFNDFDVPAATTRILTPLLNTENLANDSTTFVLAYSPSSRLSTQSFDYDWDNDGDVDLPAGLVFVDSIAIKDDSAADRLYGPGGEPGVGNVIDVFAAKNYVPDGVSRKTGNNATNNAAAWFHGDLLPTGDDPLVYTIARSTDLPLAPNSGTAITPGEANTTPTSPLVFMSSVSPNPNGTFSVAFSFPVTQLLLGSGGNLAGISVTDPAGTAIPGVNIVPNVTGVGTATWTVSFAGPNAPSGALPPGSYRLNFTGNNLIGNGRAVDAAASGAVPGSDRQIAFNVVAATGDYNKNGTVDAADYVLWRNSVGQTGAGLAADGDGDMDVDDNDRLVWRANFGRANTATIVPGSASAASIVASDHPADIEFADAFVAAAARDKALFDWPTTAAAAKAEKVKGESWRSGAVPGSSSLDQLLLTVQNGSTDDSQVEFDSGADEGNSDETNQVDEVFTELGDDLV